MAVLLLGITSAQAFIPGTPINGANTTSCGWIYCTWDPAAAGNVTDGYNISYDANSDGSVGWSNYSHAYLNLGGHTTHQNVTTLVYAFNNTGSGNLSLTSLSLGKSVVNCPINMTDCASPLSYHYGGTLTFDLGYTDGDEDVATFDGNNSFGTFDSTTGIYTWIILNKSDVGTYNWQFNVTESNATVSGFDITKGYCNVSLTIVMPTSSRGAPALTPIGIVAAIGTWSMLILVYKRKRK